MSVCGAKAVSSGEVRGPQPVGTATGAPSASFASPVYCLTTMPANEVSRTVEFRTWRSWSTVAVDGGAVMSGTVVSNTMPPVRFDRSHPVLNRTPGALPETSPLIQLTSPVTSWTSTAADDDRTVPRTRALRPQPALPGATGLQQDPVPGPEGGPADAVEAAPGPGGAGARGPVVPGPGVDVVGGALGRRDGPRGLCGVCGGGVRDQRGRAEGGGREKAAWPSAASDGSSSRCHSSNRKHCHAGCQRAVAPVAAVRRRPV